MKQVEKIKLFNDIMNALIEDKKKDISKNDDFSFIKDYSKGSLHAYEFALETFNDIMNNKKI